MGRPEAEWERRARFKRGLRAIADPPPKSDFFGRSDPSPSDIQRAMEGYYYQPQEQPRRRHRRR